MLCLVASGRFDCVCLWPCLIAIGYSIFIRIINLIARFHIKIGIGIGIGIAFATATAAPLFDRRFARGRRAFGFPSFWRVTR